MNRLTKAQKAELKEVLDEMILCLEDRFAPDASEEDLAKMLAWLLSNTWDATQAVMWAEENLLHSIAEWKDVPELPVLNFKDQSFLRDALVKAQWEMVSAKTAERMASEYRKGEFKPLVF